MFSFQSVTQNHWTWKVLPVHHWLLHFSGLGFKVAICNGRNKAVATAHTGERSRESVAVGPQYLSGGTTTAG